MLRHTDFADHQNIYRQHCTVNVQFTRDAGLFCVGQVAAKLRLLSDEKSSLQTQSVWHTCSHMTPAITYPLSVDLPSSASSSEISQSQCKNSSPVISTPHTFPLIQYPVQTFCALTGNHPLLGILVPVVLGGSCSSSMGVANTAPLCVGKTSLPTRHCIALIWVGRGRGGGAFRYIVQLPLL